MPYITVESGTLSDKKIDKKWNKRYNIRKFDKMMEKEELWILVRI